MTKIFNMLAASVLVACGCLFASQAEARVCFATDPDCGAGGNFGNMNDLKQYDDACNEAGYDQTSCETGKLKYICPYKNSWLKCCNMDYSYSSCVYPMQTAGECGGKFKCTCDQSKYPWTQERCAANSKDSMTGGASCAEQVLNDSGTALDTKLYYTECRCDRGMYPYTADMCDKNATFGDSCMAIDSAGARTEYFSSCYCDRQVYRFSAAGCFPFVGAEESGRCTSGGVTYYKTCKTCSGWPADNLDHVAADPKQEPLPEDYEVCPYAQTTGYYKILRCREPGYEVNGDGSACVPISCTKAAQMFVAHNSNYVLMTGNGLYTYTESINGTNGVSTYTPKSASGSTKTVIVAEDISAYSSYFSSGYYYSAQYLGKEKEYSTYGKILANSCNKAPVVTFKNAYFPKSGTGNYFYSYGIDYKMAYTTYITNTVYLYNGKFELAGKTLYINGRLSADKNDAYPNVDNLYIGSGTSNSGDINIRSSGVLWMKKYNLGLNTLNIQSVEYNDGERADKFNSIRFWLEGSPSDYVTVSANNLQIKALGGIKNANAYIQVSCIGCDLNSSRAAQPDTVHHFSMLYLFDTNWYMSKDRTTHIVYIGPGCFLGNGYSRDTDGNTGNTGWANIVYADNTQYPYINSPTQYDNCKNGSSCTKASFDQGYVVKSNGSLQWVDQNWCSIWCDSASDGSDYGNQAICAVNGNKDHWFAGRGGNKDCFLELGFGSFRM